MVATTTRSKTDTIDTIRIRVHANWTAADFALLFLALDQLYQFFGRNKFTSRLLVSPDARLGALRDALVDSGDHRRAARLIAKAIRELPKQDAPPVLIEQLRMAYKKPALLERAALEGLLSYLISALNQSKLTEVMPLESSDVRHTLYADCYSYLVRPQARLLVQYDPSVRLDPLDIRRVQIASPGFTDIAGIGQIIGHVKDLVVEALKLKQSRELNSAQAAKIHAEAEAIRMQSAAVRSKVIEDRIEHLRKLGVPQEQLIQLAQEAYLQRKQIAKFAADGHIVGVETLNGDG